MPPISPLCASLSLCVLRSHGVSGGAQCLWAAADRGVASGADTCSMSSGSLPTIPNMMPLCWEPLILMRTHLKTHFIRQVQWNWIWMLGNTQMITNTSSRPVRSNPRVELACTGNWVVCPQYAHSGWAVPGKLFNALATGQVHIFPNNSGSFPGDLLAQLWTGDYQILYVKEENYMRNHNWEIIVGC